MWLSHDLSPRWASVGTECVYTRCWCHAGSKHAHDSSNARTRMHIPLILTGTLCNPSNNMWTIQIHLERSASPK